MIRIKRKKDTYLDFASATPLSSFVARAMKKAEKYYANPSSIHALGVEARKVIDLARKDIATAFEARLSEVVFTSGATEANALAMIGAVSLWQKKYPERTPHIMVSLIEHPSVLETAAMLEKRGAVVTKIPVSENGIVDVAFIKNNITPDTVIISVMYANNEIGTMQPIRDIAKIIRSSRETTNVYPLFHVDACQAVQYEAVGLVKTHADLLVVNASKIYGPRGIGALFVRKGVLLDPLFLGGEQEHGLRAGTEPTELIVGFAAAVKQVVEMREKETKRLTKIRDDSFLYIKNKLPTAIINGDQLLRLPNNVSISLPSVDSDYLLLELSEKGIYASSKSACGMENGDTSHVILAIGGDPLAGNLRFSFGRTTTMDDMHRAIDIVAKALEKWNRFSTPTHS